MSIDAKQTFVNAVKNILSDKLTMTELTYAIDAVSDELSHYKMERFEDGDNGMEFTEMLETFLSAKQVEGKSPRTIKHYRYVLGRLRDDAKTPIRDYTAFTIRNWLSKEKERGIADKTLKTYREVFSSFFGWLYKEGLLSKNTCANVAPIKCRKKVPLPYSEVDLECIKENCMSTRDRAIVAFLLSTGCRVSEMCALNRDSVDFHNMECTVLGKGDKERPVFIDDVTAMLLQRYMDERKDTEEALFVGRGTSRLSQNGVRAMLKRVAKNAHVENVHPHRFRRTLATNLIDHGMQIQDVASLLGHEKLDTTLKYVYIDKNNVKNAYRKYA